MPPRIPTHLGLYLVSVSNSCSRTSSVASSSRCTSVCLSKENKRLLSTAALARLRRRVSLTESRCSGDHLIRKVCLHVGWIRIPPYSHIHNPQRDFHSSSPAFASAKDPYEVLDIPKNASASEIKKKYYEVRGFLYVLQTSINACAPISVGQKTSSRHKQGP